jgi:hypothetical protein
MAFPANWQNPIRLPAGHYQANVDPFVLLSSRADLSQVRLDIPENVAGLWNPEAHADSGNTGRCHLGRSPRGPISGRTRRSLDCACRQSESEPGAVVHHGFACEVI